MNTNRKLKLMSMVLFSTVFLFSACKEDSEGEEPMENNEMKNLELSITGLEDLGENAIYEGWIIVDGAPVTTGTFKVDGDGMMSKTSFPVMKEYLDKATTFVLTVEPMPDTDPAPSKVHILAGDFSGDDASLTIDHMAALNTSFGSSEGIYLIATPTDGENNNEESGLWFLDNSSGTPAYGLNLPELPEGWIYEGWAVIDGTPVSTGTFSDGMMADNSAPFSGSMMAPPFPGEDFLMNAPAGLTFPTDIRGGMAVISVEPVPDNSAAPFVLKPLVGMIDANAMTHSTYSLNQNLSFPTGTAAR